MIPCPQFDLARTTMDGLLNPLILATLATTKLWHLAPLLTSVSLVYAATRHELVGPILLHALRFAIWIILFMAAVFVIIQLIEMAM
jgi:hypothetical protein